MNHTSNERTLVMNSMLATKQKPNWPVIWLTYAVFGGLSGALTVAYMAWSAA
jgi:hypothetical protein